MQKEKRKLRTYKTKDSIYDKAQNRAKKEKFRLSKLIEGALDAYGKGRNYINIDEIKKKTLLGI